MKIEELIEYINSYNHKENLSKEKSSKYLPIVKDNLQYLKELLTRPVLSKFLYYNCHLFNRFSTPSDRYHTKHDILIYEEYLNLFIKIENGYMNNILTLLIDKLIFQLLNKVEKNESIKIEKYYDELNNIDLLKHCLSEDKRAEYLEHYEKLTNIIEGYKTNRIITIATCSIPVSPVKKNTIINTIYNNKSIKITLTPLFNNTIHTITTDSKSVISQNSNSSWQHSICNIRFEIYGYLDLLKISEKLYSEYDEVDKHNPFIFKFLYETISNISWQLRNKNNEHLTNWLAFPNDIENITFELNSNNHIIQWVNYPIKTGFKIQNFDKSIDTINIDFTNQVLWHEKCLILAKDYLSLGDSHLSIFWLNIGIEAFFEYKIDEICNELELKKDIFFSENYYDKVKQELIKHNSKEIFKSIIWPPEYLIHTSVYKKLNKLFNNKILDSSLKRNTIAKYSHISSKRNAIFHGTNNKHIEVEVVLKAIESYSWLLENFKYVK
ncbi:hypothetical protein [Empedobacter sp.]|uniref:hypothetical protein n=1 Tax=Empedobacter sp. TaxID=1927715 RepID=UPI0028999D38|nr:hypothetical protein [Empedobacter sp.]